jgi:phosphoglucomutase/phosphomannomutase
MTTTFELATQKESLRSEFSKLTNDPAVIERAITLLDDWLSNPLCANQHDYVIQHIAHGQYALLLDSFYQFVPFGTGGRRGRVGYGPNRINDVTVALSVQGHCDYLKSLAYTGKTNVVVAYDVRVFNDLAGTYAFLGQHPLLKVSSRILGRLACEIYAANGFTAYLPPQATENFLSTPELSFQIRRLGGAGGMNVSASHNHPDDNGFKFYTAEGAQDIPPTDEKIAGFMNSVKNVRRTPFDQAVRDGHIRELDAESHRAYLDLNLSLRTRTETPAQHAIVYTPLCGTGDSTVGDVLREAGYNLRVFEQQAQHDGTFATVPSRLPNPEIPRAAHPAIRFAESVDAHTIFSTDPDADRIGVIAKSADGSWRYLTGNEIATTILYYLALDRDFGPRRKGIVIKTLVTTKLIEEIARAGDCPIVSDLLVGFKYIANVLSLLEREGRFRDIRGAANDLLIAAEESHGVLLTPHIRDKDAAGGALLMAELATQLREADKFLPEYFDAVAREYGNYINGAGSLVMRGIRGSQALATMMRSLRENPPTEIGGRAVRAQVDYLDEQVLGPILSETDRMSRNLILLRLDGADVVVRPSGTEPKVKIYVDLSGRAFGVADDREEARRLAQTLAAEAGDMLMERIGVRLSASAKMLPDFIDLDLKQRFDNEFRTALVQSAAQLGGQSSDEQKEWLRRELAAFVAGADPLEATSEAVAHLAGELGLTSMAATAREALTQ